MSRTSRSEYYRLRRQRLRRLRLCTRCGEVPPKEGHTLCGGCLAVKAVKYDQTADMLQRLKERRKKDVLRRLAEVRQIEQRLQLELAKIAS